MAHTIYLDDNDKRCRLAKIKAYAGERIGQKHDYILPMEQVASEQCELNTDEFIENFLTMVDLGANVDDAAMSIGGNIAAENDGYNTQADDADKPLQISVQSIDKQMQTLFDARIEHIRVSMAKQDIRSLHRRLAPDQRLFN